MSTRNETHRRGSVLKSLAGVVIVIIAVGSVLAGLNRGGPNESPSSAGSVPPETASELVTVYYFHGDVRCETCLAIESQTAKVIQDRFPDQVENHRLEFEIVNFEAPGGQRYRDTYQLAFGTVVVQGGGAEGSWENLSEVWTLYEDAEAFEAYIAEHVRRMLKQAG